MGEGVVRKKIFLRNFKKGCLTGSFMDSTEVYIPYVTDHKGAIG
jgi:hypothetical protein